MISKYKYIKLEYDEVNKQLLIEDNKIVYALPKRYTMPLLGFLTRVAKRGLHLNRKKR